MRPEILRAGKIVRDKIPEIILKETGKVDCTVVNHKAELICMLLDKVREELDEFCTAELVGLSDREAVEELADIVEVCFALAKVSGFSAEELEKIRLAKREEKGGFDKAVWLYD